MQITDAIFKGILVGLFMAISVGPTLFAVIKYSLNFSYKAGLAFVLGVSVSDLLYVTLANFAAAWLTDLEPFERYIAIGGSVALMAIGISGTLKKHVPKRPSSEVQIITNGRYMKIWLSGFLINTLNPGVLVTWLGAVTLIATESAVYRFFLFGTCLIIILGFDFLKVFLAEKIKGLLTVRRILYLQRISSACIFLLGVSLMVTTLIKKPVGKNAEKSKIDKIITRDREKEKGHGN